MENMRNVLKISKTTLIAVFIIWGMGACDKQETAQQKYEREQETLEKYIADNNITTVPTYTGLYYIETLAGTGERAGYGRTVSVYYEGRFLDGTVFDASKENEPLIFQVGYGQVIPGWDEALQLMRDGGKATLIIPSTMAYGPYGSGSVPPYTTLIFDVEITNVL